VLSFQIVDKKSPYRNVGTFLIALRGAIIVVSYEIVNTLATILETTLAY